MKAFFYPQVECPKCPQLKWEGTDLPPPTPLMVFNGDGTIECMNPDCELFGIKFKRPSVEVELERVEDEKATKEEKL